MSTHNTKDKMNIREAVGIFYNYDDMEKAIGELEISGFERRHISVLGSHNMLKDRFGDEEVSADLLEDNPNAPRSANVKKEELGIGQGALVSGSVVAGVTTAILASGGIAAPGIVTTVLAGGTGGVAVGAVLAKLLGDKYAEFFQNQIDNGGLLLWVNTPSKDMEEKAQSILKQYGAKDIHLHDVPLDNFSGNEKSHIMGLAFVKLDHIIDDYKDILTSDMIINNKLSKAMNLLKEHANSNEYVSENEVNNIFNYVVESAVHAKDMAEEEQRMVSENMSESTESESDESDKYFALADDLDNFVQEYKDGTTN